MSHETQYNVMNDSSPLPSDHHATTPSHITTLVACVVILFHFIRAGATFGPGLMIVNVYVYNL
jgi:hypothetical protein